MTPNTVDLAALPTPQSVTLLLKNKKSTTLLSLQPTSSFDDIKALLLAALQSRNVPNIPNSPASVELGVLADRRDASRGWVSLGLRAQEIAAGKNAKKAVDGKKSVSNSTVEGAGLVDGSWVAWRVVQSAEGEKVQTDEDGDAVIDLEEREDPGWDVDFPKYEDEEDG